MRIVVCIKQVPDTESMKFDTNTKTIVRSGVKNIVNPFDLYAVEEAIRIKEKNADPSSVEIIAITMGPPTATESLREVIAMGVDKGYLISDRKLAGSDTLATSYTLAKAIEKIGDVDLIIAGKQAIDGDTAQVGPGIASFLDIPQITMVRKIEEITDNSIKAERMIEDGYEVIEAPLPALITVVKEINEPRLPSLRGKMKAKKAEIPTWTVEDINVEDEKVGLNGSPTKVVKAFAPKHEKNTVKIEGTPEEIAQKIVSVLKEKHLI